jgi:hypothetical protein
LAHGFSVVFSICFGANCLAFNRKGDYMTQEALISEIRQIMAAIELDLDPYARGDSMNYTGYLAENAADLKLYVTKLLGE